VIIRRLAAGAVVAGVSLLIFEVSSVCFRDTDAKGVLIREAEAADAVEAPGKYAGASSCDGASCHGKNPPKDTPPALNEFTTWKGSPPDAPPDRHSVAFKALKDKAKGGDERSAGIMKKLNEIEKSNDTAETSERCLTCHGVAVHDYGVGKKNPGAAVGKHPELQLKNYKADDGVSCDGCHGPAEKWVKKHDKKEWATKEWAKDGGKSGGSQKLYDEYGIYYSKDLELWANQCVRCHLKLDSNMEEAGHPILVPFELFYQSSATPHWRDYSTAKDSPELPAAGPMNAAYLWQTGQAAALREALQQVVAHAKAKPELLKGTVERAQSHYTVFRHALKTLNADAAKQFDEAMPKLDPAAAEKLVAVIAPLVRAAADAKIAAADVNGLIKDIANDPAILESQANADQAARAFYALNSARLSASNPAALAENPPKDPVIVAINAMFDKPDPKGAEFKKALESIKGAIK
jgi:hypothetical protein